MVLLNFTLTAEASARLHDSLFCLAKFSDTVSIEAKRDGLTLSALNSSKSAYSSFFLDRKYLSFYEFVAENGRSDGIFTCSILNKALLSVFKSRIIDARGRDTAIEKCEVSVQERADETQCRFIIRMFCSHGITKTYKLTYETIEVLHALFDKNTANNHWTIRAAFLREFTDYFGQKADQLDVYAEEGKVTFISFTEKIINKKNEVLKHPLKTAVTVNTTDFERFAAQEKMHIVISVKDFKSIVLHADTLNTVIGADYSTPGRPLQFSYSKDGIHCQFTLMTRGDYCASPTPSAAPSITANRNSLRAPSMGENNRPISSKMPPPVQLNARNTLHRLGRKHSNHDPGITEQRDDASDSLFVPADEEDRRWDPTDYEQDEESLGWDATANNDVSFHPTFRDSGPASRSNTIDSVVEGMPPTQTISQVKSLGLFTN